MLELSVPELVPVPDEPELPDEPEPDVPDEPEPDEPERDVPDVPEPDVPDEPELPDVPPDMPGLLTASPVFGCVLLPPASLPPVLEPDVLREPCFLDWCFEPILPLDLLVPLLPLAPPACDCGSVAEVPVPEPLEF